MKAVWLAYWIIGLPLLWETGRPGSWVRRHYFQVWVPWTCFVGVAAILFHHWTWYLMTAFYAAWVVRAYRRRRAAAASNRAGLGIARP